MSRYLESIGVLLIVLLLVGVFASFVVDTKSTWQKPLDRINAELSAK